MIVPVLHMIILKPDLHASKKKLDEYKERAEASGLIVLSGDSDAEAMREQSGVDTGTVVAIGPLAYRDYKTNCPFVIGDRVVTPKYAGKHIIDEYTKEILWIVTDEDITAILKEGTNG